MGDERRRMAVGEFARQGFLQEVNRLLLHRAGLALVAEGGQLWVWDATDDPEGIAFADGLLRTDQAIGNALNVAAAMDQVRPGRMRLLGFDVQPIPGCRNPGEMTEPLPEAEAGDDEPGAVAPGIDGTFPAKVRGVAAAAIARGIDAEIMAGLPNRELEAAADALVQGLAGDQSDREVTRDW